MKFRFDLENLPQELKAQLKTGRIEEMTRLIIEAVEGLDGYASVDEVVVQLWKLTKKIHKRSYIANKLYRMVKEGHLQDVPKTKGVYKLAEAK